jgi:DNA-binding response OmpR family regulator
MHQSSMRILCIEDDRDSCEVMEALLGQMGYEVITAHTVAEGLRLAKGGDFCLILLDSLYPDGTGIELCKHIRSFDSHTPILFYTGLSNDVEIREGMGAGAQGYFIKPDIMPLLHTISERTSTDSGIDQ